MWGVRLFAPPQMPVRAEALRSLELLCVTTATAELQSLLPTLPCLTALRLDTCKGGEGPGDPLQGPVDSLR